jgi:hypothetical protein
MREETMNIGVMSYRVWCVDRDADGEVIHHRHPGDASGVEREPTIGARPAENALDREFQVGVYEKATIEELHDLAQRELPGRVVDRAPRDREARPDLRFSSTQTSVSNMVFTASKWLPSAI